MEFKIFQTTPVGFEPTRGDPIGLAGRRLSRSAKVSVVIPPVPWHTPLPPDRSTPLCGENRFRGLKFKSRSLSRNGGLPDFHNFYTPKTQKAKIVKNKPRRPEPPASEHENPEGAKINPANFKPQTFLKKGKS